VNRRRWLVSPLRQVKLQNLRTVGIPCLYKSYKLKQTHSPRVSFPSPAHRPVEGCLFLIHVDGWLPLSTVNHGGGTLSSNVPHQKKETSPPPRRTCRCSRGPGAESRSADALLAPPYAGGHHRHQNEVLRNLLCVQRLPYCARRSCLRGLAAQRMESGSHFVWRMRRKADYLRIHAMRLSLPGLLCPLQSGVPEPLPFLF